MKNKDDELSSPGRRLSCHVIEVHGKPETGARGIPLHVVWCPKYRFRILEGAAAKYVEERIKSIREWKHSEVEELNVMNDYVHMVVIVPPKVSISELILTVS